LNIGTKTVLALCEGVRSWCSTEWYSAKIPGIAVLLPYIKIMFVEDVVTAGAFAF